MADRTPGHPRPRVLLVLVVVAAAALSGVARFTEAATTPDSKDRTSWYDTVGAAVEILTDGGWVAVGDLSDPRGAGRMPAIHADVPRRPDAPTGRDTAKNISTGPAKHR